MPERKLFDLHGVHRRSQWRSQGSLRERIAGADGTEGCRISLLVSLTGTLQGSAYAQPFPLVSHAGFTGFDLPVIPQVNGNWTGGVVIDWNDSGNLEILCLGYRWSWRLTEQRTYSS